MKQGAPRDDIGKQIRRYATSHFGKALLWVAADSFSFYYLTDVLRLPPWETGWFFLALLLWSAITDAMAGWACDRWPLSDTRIRAVIRWAALVAALAFATSFAVPATGTMTWPWLILASLLFRTAYSAFDVPHNALLARLTAAGADGMRLSSARLALTMLATLAVTAGAPWLLAGDSATHARFAILAGSTALAAAAGVLFGLPRFDTVPSPPAVRQISLAVDHRLCVIFAVALTGTMLASLLMKAVLYLGDVMPSYPGGASQALLLATIGKLAGASLWAALVRHGIGPLNANRLACVMIVLIAPLLMTAGTAFPVMAIALPLLGVALAGTTIAPWALLSEWFADRSGTPGALWFGLFTGASKVGLGLSGWLLALLLGWLDVQAGGAYARRDLMAASAALLAGGALLGLALLTLLRSGSLRASGRDRSGHRGIGQAGSPGLDTTGEAAQP